MKRLYCTMVLWLVLCIAFLAFATFAHGAAPPDFTVRVFAVNDTGTKMGSGFLVSNRLVLTNHHVIRDGGDITVLFTDWETVTGKVIRSNKKWDLALIEIPVQVRGIVTLGKTPAFFDVVSVHGFGVGIPAASFGVVYYNKDYIKVTGLKPRRGDSGSPLLNDKGEVVGILFGQQYGNTLGTGIGKIKWFLN